ncbi:VirB2 family type IV secretion system major pilin TrwL [Bartonella sp. CB175]|uniref:VirB2 family type IV secretion system major pilin TrwL n=1 Tax=Bartonella sp. CB175 TaxID=3112256 RepID=UPI00300E404D
MRYLKTFQSKMKNKITFSAAAMTVFFIDNPALANNGLSKVNKALGKLKTELDTVIPFAAAVILLCLAISYAGRFIEKDTFLRWSVGVIIAGSAASISNMLLPGIPGAA